MARRVVHAARVPAAMKAAASAVETAAPHVAATKAAAAHVAAASPMSAPVAIDGQWSEHDQADCRNPCRQAASQVNWTRNRCSENTVVRGAHSAPFLAFAMLAITPQGIAKRESPAPGLAERVIPLFTLSRFPTQ
jgi:hypothetical protein